MRSVVCVFLFRIAVSQKVSANASSNSGYGVLDRSSGDVGVSGRGLDLCMTQELA